MNAWQQGWLVALREVRERSRSRAFRASLVIMVLVVVAVIIVPEMIDTEGGKRDIGLAEGVPEQLREAIRSRSEAAGMSVGIRRYEDLGAGEEAVRSGEIDVLVVASGKLEWQQKPDEELRAVLAGAIQVITVQERAAAVGIEPDDLRSLVAPIRIEDRELGRVAGRSSDDESAAFIMTVLLFMAIATYGSLVLSGVVEEKSSRVVEVLLARMPARNLLIGKIAGIGLLGLGQVLVTALAALVAVRMVDSIDVPAVRGTVLGWLVVWFVLGYLFYATVYGALGSLASRTEDAQTVAGPITMVLLVGYFVSFATIGSPGTTWARLVSFLPPTAPLAMPNRIAMGATEWWEPVIALALTIGAIAVILEMGGRVYSRAVLRTGRTLRLRDVLRSAPTSTG